MRRNTVIPRLRLGGMALALLATQGLAPGALADQSREVEATLGRIADSARSVTPTAVSGAKATAALMSKAATAIEDANKAGEWTEIASYVGTLKKLGRAAEAIGFLGSAANVFLTWGMPSDTERIISEIKSVDAHLDRLSKHIDDRFDKMERRNEWGRVKDQMTPHLSSIDAFNDDWANYQTAVQKKELRVGPQLKGREPKELHDAAKSLADNCTGSNDKTDVFDAVIEYSRGDVSLVLQQGQLILLRIADAQRNYAALDAYSAAKDGDASDNLLQEAAATSVQEFQPYLSACYDAMEAAIRRIADRSEVGKLIADQALDDIEKLPKIKPALWPAHLGAALEKRYPLYEFLVISYNPVSGTKNHYHRWFTAGSVKKYRTTVHGTERNFVVAWARRADRHNDTWASGCGPKLASVSGAKVAGSRPTGLPDNTWVVSYKDEGEDKVAYSSRYDMTTSATSADLWSDLAKPICGDVMKTADFFWIGRKWETGAVPYVTEGAGHFHGDSPLVEHHVLYPRTVLPLRFPEPQDRHKIVLTNDPARCITKASGGLRVEPCALGGADDGSRSFGFVDDVFLKHEAAEGQCLAIEGGKPVAGKAIVLSDCEGDNDTRLWRFVKQTGVFMSAARRGSGVCLGKAAESDELVSRSCGFESRDDIQFRVERAL